MGGRVKGVGGAHEKRRAEKIEKIKNGGTERFSTSPQRQGEEVGGSVEAESEQGGEEQEAVGGDLELRQTGDGFWRPNLTLGDADERFFIAVVTLDLPTINVSLNDGLKGKIDVGADQEGGLAVEDLGSFGKAVTKRLDDNQTQGKIRTGLAPEERGDGFALDLLDLAGDETFDCLKGNGVVF